MSTSSTSHTSKIDHNQIKTENDDVGEVVTEDAEITITLFDDEDDVVMEGETIEEAEQQLPRRTSAAEDIPFHVRISRRLGGNHLTLCFQTLMSVLASNSQEIMASLRFLKLVSLANIHVGFDRRTEVLAVEYGPTGRRMHMFVRDDESLKNVVQVLLPQLRLERILEVLVIDRPSFMS